MTFLYSFFPDSTAFIFSVDIHPLSDMICTPHPWPSWHFLLQAVPTKATEKFKSDFFFFFLIHSYTYVVPISPVPKYSGGLSLRKKCLESWKVLLRSCTVHVLPCGRFGLHRPTCELCLCGSSRRQHKTAGSQSLCVSLPDGPLCHNDSSYVFFCSLVYKNMGGLLQQKAYSQQSALSSLLTASRGGPTSDGMVCNDPLFALELLLERLGCDVGSPLFEAVSNRGLPRRQKSVVWFLRCPILRGTSRRC